MEQLRQKLSEANHVNQDYRSKLKESAARLEEVKTQLS